MRIKHSIGVRFSIFDYTLFGGIRKIGYGATSRWAILPPSNETFLLDAAHRLLLPVCEQKPPYLNMYQQHILDNIYNFTKQTPVLYMKNHFSFLFLLKCPVIFTSFRVQQTVSWNIFLCYIQARSIRSNKLTPRV